MALAKKCDRCGNFYQRQKCMAEFEKFMASGGKYDD